VIYTNDITVPRWLGAFLKLCCGLGLNSRPVDIGTYVSPSVVLSCGATKFIFDNSAFH